MKKLPGNLRRAFLFSVTAFQHSVLLRKFFVFAAILTVLTSALQRAQAETITITVESDVVLFQGLRYADGGGQCVNAYHVVWKEFPGTLSATAFYSVTGTQNATVSATFPYHNAGQAESPGSAGFPAAAEGTNRLELGWNSMAGPSPSRADLQAECDKLAAKLDENISDVATVELTINKPATTKIVSVPGELTLGSNRQALIGKITCPSGGVCTIAAAPTVNVTIAKKVYKLTVKLPKSVKAGRTEPITVTFPRAAADALKGRKVTVRIRVQGANFGLIEKDKILTRSVRRNR